MKVNGTAVIMDSNLIKGLHSDKTAEVSRLGIARRFTQRTVNSENESKLAKSKYVVTFALET